MERKTESGVFVQERVHGSDKWEGSRIRKLSDNSTQNEAIAQLQATVAALLAQNELATAEAQGAKAAQVEKDRQQEETRLQREEAQASEDREQEMERLQNKVESQTRLNLLRDQLDALRAERVSTLSPRDIPRSAEACWLQMGFRDQESY